MWGIVLGGQALGLGTVARVELTALLRFRYCGILLVHLGARKSDDRQNDDRCLVEGVVLRCHGCNGSMVLGSIYAGWQQGFRKFDQVLDLIDKITNALAERVMAIQKSLKSKTSTPSCTSCAEPLWQS